MDWSVVDRVEVSNKKGHWVLRYGYKANPEIRQTVWVREEDWIVTRIERESRKEMVEVVFLRVELGTKPALDSFRFVPPKGARRMKWLRR
jgi:outer membrane lipoprotein-sorting protein